MQNAGVTAHVAEKKVKGESWALKVVKKTFHWIPVMVWIIGLYFVISLFGIKPHQEIFTLPNNTMILVSDVFYLIMSSLILLDLYKVSVPGIDNSWEAQFMNYVSMIMVILFVLAFFSPEFEMFATPQFAIMTILNFIAALVAVKVNARTLKRTIDGRGASSDSGDEN